MSKIQPNVSDLKKSEFVKWSPNDRQRFIKAKFWSRIKDNPTLDPAAMSINGISDLCGSSAVEKWLGEPPFRAWFFDSDTVPHLIQAGAELAMRTLVDVMNTDGEKVANARVKAAEVVLRYAGYEPPRLKAIEFLDEDIHRMEEPQLREFLRQVTKRLKSED